jgi:hypothetical protein
MKPGTLLLSYTDLRQEVHDPAGELAGAHGWTFAPVAIDPEDPEHYWRELRDAYAACASSGTSLLSVEGDNVVHAGVFEALAACDHLVCGFPYWEGRSHNTGLGCTAFSSDLVAQHPDLIECLAAIPPDNFGPPTDWRFVCSRVYQVLVRRGIGLPVNHGTIVGHLKTFEHPDPGEECPGNTDGVGCATHTVNSRWPFTGR